MSRASCATTLGHLAEYRGIVDALTKLLDDEAAADVPAVLERLAAVDTHLQQSASRLLDERAQRERTVALSESAGERRTELLQLASKLQRTETQLSTLAAQAREALEATDESHRLGRKVSAAALIEYAERVSYSNAAPVGAAALETAAKDGFRGGWGTPAPQQHMLAVSRFCELTRRAAAGGPAASAQDGAAAAAHAPAALSDTWTPGLPIPGPPADWKPGMPVPGPPPGWKPGMPVPGPPVDWKPGMPIPGLAGAGRANGAPAPAPGATANVPGGTSVKLGLADSDDDEED